MIEFAILSCQMRVMGKSGIWAQTHCASIMNLCFANRAFVSTISFGPPNLVGLDDPFCSTVDRVSH
jgi:hypothetical protein